ncbi:helix-turn-helix transcriptional regulator [Variovorax sp. J31P179]|jgi:transcriptional regulator with XRE-family HTH domain|uniref:helix-turn-helix domain-containing protein n=1 Tax=Variovorax sp. J31P179 TaxID=3053508 RepID=UPI002576B2D8|nr:helix-turn-helix transcriptional regulator [Variovorax sp. J31P179]MDM0082870.1 helix-turn-helix transcriptional regulator [Variovorax sp. J31P179]
MALTDFGKAIRKARIDTGETLGSMAEALGVTAAFLSGIETGRKKVPADLVGRVRSYFANRSVHLGNLEQLAAVANKTVPIDGLSPQHQMLVAGFARSSMDAETLEKMAALLSASEGVKKK